MELPSDPPPQKISKSRFKGTVLHVGKHVYSLSCRELDEKIDTTVMSV